ncbi:hypothetical protein B0A55_03387 [Friedmanniomyces simplex]|uniref:Uncharacterized protein n=1 Tax=Friedmanniomyces simplex TaxID=329884 RepID=A0A4U0XUY4_9PEZI|nr:hypothetical protein B0A55_03387 [Friedmanniomyces simplex]
MDVVQDWAAYLLNGNHAALTAYSPYLYTLYNALHLARSWLLHLIDQVSRKPDLATLALLLIIVLVSLKILDMLWQTLLFWVRLVRRLVFWGGMAALALWLWGRGPAGVVEDVRYWQGAWGQEYGYWKERERVARDARLGVGYGGRQQQQQGRWF